YVNGGNTVIENGTTTPVSFGSVSVGQTPPTKTIVVVNSGTSTLTLGAPGTMPSGFTVTGLPLSVAPGQFGTFSVQLNTATAGTYTGDISFSTNDLTQNTFHFSVAGTVGTSTSGYLDQLISGSIAVSGQVNRYSF